MHSYTTPIRIAKAAPLATILIVLSMVIAPTARSSANTHEALGPSFDVSLVVDRAVATGKDVTIDYSLNNNTNNLIFYQSGCGIAPLAYVQSDSTGRSYRLPNAVTSQTTPTNTCHTAQITVPAHGAHTFRYVYEASLPNGGYTLETSLAYTVQTGAIGSRYRRLTDSHLEDTFPTLYARSSAVVVQLTAGLASPTLNAMPIGSSTGPFYPKVLVIDYNTSGQADDGSTALTNELVQGLQTASKYHNASTSSANFQIYQTYVENNPPPVVPGTQNPDGTGQGDYQAIFDKYNVCGLAASQGVDFVWIWASGSEQGGIYFAGDFPEWVTTGPTFAQTYGTNVPTCNGHTMVTFGFNYSRPVAEALHSTGHYMENVLQAAFGPADMSGPGGTDMYDLFDGQVYRYNAANSGVPLNTSSAECGDVHFPPNTTLAYDYANTTTVRSDCATYNPGQPWTQAYVGVNASTWESIPCDPSLPPGPGDCAQQSYLMWWMQNMPGYNNPVWDVYGDPMPNWWQYILAIDTAGLLPYQPSPSTVAIAPATLDFGTQPVGAARSSQFVTITNTGLEWLTISGWGVTPNVGFGLGNTSTCPQGVPGLAPGASCTIGVTFSPMTVGPASGELQINDNGIGAPHDVSLTGIGTISIRTTFFDDFSSYTPGSPPAGYLLRGTTAMTPTVEEVGGSGPAYRVLDFPEVPWLYDNRWALRNGLVVSAPYTVTTKLNFQEDVADRAGITIAWNDANENRIDIQPNVYGDDIEFRVTYTGPISSNVQITGPAATGGGLPVNAGTNYWLRATATSSGPGQGRVVVSWSTDDIAFTPVLTATGLADLTGLVGMGTAGPHLPHVYFDDFQVQEGSTMPATPTLQINPTSGSYGQSITMTGTNFGPNETVNIYGVSTNTPPVYSTMTGADGSFVLKNTVRQGPYGPVSLIAVGQTSGITATTTFQIKPVVFVYPTSGKAGSAAYLIAMGFGAHETVAGLLYPGSTLLKAATTNGLGTAVMTFVVPPSTPGLYYALGYGLTTKAYALTPFTITATSSIGGRQGLPAPPTPAQVQAVLARLHPTATPYRLPAGTCFPLSTTLQLCP